ncbi:MAG: hypothetical protein AAFQ83_23195 [Bacteroidota bacterium]
MQKTSLTQTSGMAQIALGLLSPYGSNAYFRLVLNNSKPWLTYIFEE